MKKQISTLVGIIIIVIAAVILFGGVFAYQYFTNSETGAWKTYSNPDFSIQYPPAWKAQTQDNVVGFMPMSETIDTEGYYGEYAVVDGSKTDNFSKASVLDDFGFDNGNKSTSTVSVNGVKASLIVSEQADKSVFKAVDIEKNGHIFLIISTGKYNSDFEKFYSSFKFTN